ncbi:hypothetical protein C8R34_1404 [Nitrosomonas sp. Nm84]|uniref:hypothetical protein n=1 Tax=Nitrosomonas sp. Nm84 TaxID=200124 RepID=UPI000D774193|nr:hypothetical protein [Nitrosomonas sp. Nm84]PXW81014.1 hypothetical protein C8R34_1404 [Nitrosomonas sp. Nm84]
MNQYNDYSKHAELALASYGNFASPTPTTEELRRAEFSTKQAEPFILKYRVVAQHTDSTGLSATVFADADNNTYLTVRGTGLSDVRDFATGVFDIMLFGSTKLHPQYVSLKAKVTEWLGNGTLSPTFTVTGHSMGGFLAVGLVDDPTFANHVSHAYLYNAPGLGGFAGPFIKTVLDWMGLAPVYDQSKISNIEAAIGPIPIAGLGFDVAPPIDITIEDQMSSDVIDPHDALNHSQQVLTDALAVYSTYSQLAPNLSQEQLSKLIDAFGSTKDVAGASNSKTLESALDALRTIVLNPANGQVVLGDSQKTGAGDRDKFYTNLYALQSSTPFKDLAGNVQLIPLSDLSTSNIIAKIESNSQQGVAVRFALVALNPFILEGNGVDYSVFNTNGALERFDPDTGIEMITEWRLAA